MGRKPEHEKEDSPSNPRRGANLDQDEKGDERRVQGDDKSGSERVKAKSGANPEGHMSGNAQSATRSSQAKKEASKDREEGRA